MLSSILLCENFTGYSQKIIWIKLFLFMVLFALVQCSTTPTKSPTPQKRGKI